MNEVTLEPLVIQWRVFVYMLQVTKYTLVTRHVKCKHAYANN